jgi:2-keto-3-deoxy-L-rhamnonate aldolase RhmA
MIAACPNVKATPMIRLPDAQEWHIQHATDIGANRTPMPISLLLPTARWLHSTKRTRRPRILTCGHTISNAAVRNA